MVINPGSPQFMLSLSRRYVFRSDDLPPGSAACFRTTLSWKPLNKPLGNAITPISTASNMYLSPEMQLNHSLLSPIRASSSNNAPTSFMYPPMKRRPKWYWRTLSCLPYLMPLHQTWILAETAYHLHPFLENFEFLTYPFFTAIAKLPNWFHMTYFFISYIGIVRRKEWPHFFHFHVMNGLLLEVVLQVAGCVKTSMPLALYWGKIGMHFWVFFTFAYMFTVLECIRCTLAGIYADIPFINDAAYMIIPYE